MAKRLFSFPLDAEKEAQSVRELLERHQIDYFETPGSRWGFSHAGIWLKHDEDLAKAQALMRKHREQYSLQARTQYQIETGYNPNAPLKERVLFTLRHLMGRKLALLLLLFGIGLLLLYFYLFFSIFI